MSRNETAPTGIDVAAYLAAQAGARARECADLDAMFRRVTGYEPKMWGDAMVGYGAYDYTYASGRSGSMLATGFAPRARALSIYIMPGYADFGPILDRLGPHRKGKSCLYVTRLDRIEMPVLEELVAAGLADLNGIWPVRA